MLEDINVKAIGKEDIEKIQKSIPGMIFLLSKDNDTSLKREIIKTHIRRIQRIDRGVKSLMSQKTSSDAQIIKMVKSEMLFYQKKLNGVEYKKADYEDWALKEKEYIELLIDIYT